MYTLIIVVPNADPQLNINILLIYKKILKFLFPTAYKVKKSFFGNIQLKFWYSYVEN